MSLIIAIAKDFAPTPGPRLIEEGDFSGELFRTRVLRPLFEKAIAQSETILVDLDGTEGYATSFLEESFGGLARIYTSEDVAKVLRFKSEDEPFLVEEIVGYIKNANA